MLHYFHTNVWLLYLAVAACPCVHFAYRYNSHYIVVIIILIDFVLITFFSHFFVYVIVFRMFLIVWLWFILVYFSLLTLDTCFPNSFGLTVFFKNCFEICFKLFYLWFSYHYLFFKEKTRHLILYLIIDWWNVLIYQAVRNDREIKDVLLCACRPHECVTCLIRHANYPKSCNVLHTIFWNQKRKHKTDFVFNCYFYS